MFFIYSPSRECRLFEVLRWLLGCVLNTLKLNLNVFYALFAADILQMLYVYSHQSIWEVISPSKYCARAPSNLKRYLDQKNKRCRDHTFKAFLSFTLGTLSLDRANVVVAGGSTGWPIRASGWPIWSSIRMTNNLKISRRRCLNTFKRKEVCKLKRPIRAAIIEEPRR